MILNLSRGDLVRVPQNTTLHTADGFVYKISKPSYGFFVEDVHEYADVCKILLDEKFVYVKTDNLCKEEK